MWLWLPQRHTVLGFAVLVADCAVFDRIELLQRCAIHPAAPREERVDGRLQLHILAIDRYGFRRGAVNNLLRSDPELVEPGTEPRTVRFRHQAPAVGRLVVRPPLRNRQDAT